MSRILAFVSVCLLAGDASASTIKGVAYRVSSDSFLLSEVRNHGAPPSDAAPDTFGVDLIDYHGTFGRTIVWIREGWPELVDPDRPDMPVEAITSEVYADYSLTTVICRDEEVFVVGVLIRADSRSETTPCRGDRPRVYWHMRGADRRELASAVRKLILESEIRIGCDREFHRVGDSVLAQPLSEFAGALEASPSTHEKEKEAKCDPETHKPVR